jgi:PIN domain nuclease of toxin-antitoxin system
LRLLFDTHALLWWLSGDAQLGQAACDLIADPSNDILVSVVSLWEIQVKVRVGKLDADLSDVLRAIEAQDLKLVPIVPAHLLCLGTLPLHHKDPFDHLLIAQAITEAVIFLSDDRHASRYPVQVMACASVRTA